MGDILILDYVEYIDKIFVGLLSLDSEWGELSLLRCINA